jgi:hypothetical protein
VNRARVATLALTVALAATGVAVAPGARAQGAPNPAPADTTAVQYFARAGGLARYGLSPYADLRWRLDQVRDRPGATGDLGLGRATFRGGLVFEPSFEPSGGGAVRVRAEAGARGTFGSDSNTDPWAAVLNETADTLGVDRLSVRIASRSGALQVAIGKQRSPLRLTEMIWDDDLRPVGIAAIGRQDRSATTARLGLAWFTRSRPDRDDAEIAVAELTAALHEDAARGGDLALAWLHVESPVDLARDQIQRQNAAVATPTGHVYAADFDLLDFQLGARTMAGALPVSLRLDLATNTAIRAENNAVRVRLALGGPGVPGGAEVGWVFQWIEREALAGAFNSDDWWFHSRMRGNQLWLRLARGDLLELRLAGFRERREDLTTPTRRLTAQITARLPAQ